MTKEEMLEQIRLLSEEDQMILTWKMIGQNLRPWTEAQQVSYLLDTLTCPEGHMGPFSHFYLTGTTHLLPLDWGGHVIMKEPGKMLPMSKRFDEQAGFDIRPEIDGVYCEACGDMKIEGNFWVPEYVLDHFFENYRSTH